VSLFGFLFRRHIAGLLFNAFVRAATGVTSRDTQCGLKGLRRGALQAVARALSMDGFAFDVEMLLVARALGFRIAEVPVNVRYESARSSVTVLLSGRAMVLDIAKIAVRRARGLYSPARLRKLSGVDASPGAGEGSPLA
jgi:dolichyl-phosphate beta-glucosyltransferase